MQLEGWIRKILVQCLIKESSGRSTLEICNKLNIYAYDAYLIQCALKTSTSLLTLDNRLLAAAEKLGVKVLEV